MCGAAARCVFTVQHGRYATTGRPLRSWRELTGLRRENRSSANFDLSGSGEAFDARSAPSLGRQHSERSAQRLPVQIPAVRQGAKIIRCLCGRTDPNIGATAGASGGVYLTADRVDRKLRQRYSGVCAEKSSHMDQKKVRARGDSLGTVVTEDGIRAQELLLVDLLLFQN